MERAEERITARSGAIRRIAIIDLQCIVESDWHDRVMFSGIRIVLQRPVATLGALNSVNFVKTKKLIAAGAF